MNKLYYCKGMINPRSEHPPIISASSKYIAHSLGYTENERVSRKEAEQIIKQWKDMKDALR